MKDKIFTKSIRYLISSSLIITVFLKGQVGDLVLMANAAAWIAVLLMRTPNKCRKTGKTKIMMDDVQPMLTSPRQTTKQNEPQVKPTAEKNSPKEPADDSAKDALNWYHFIGKPLLTDLITELNTRGKKSMSIRLSGDVELSDTETEHIDDFPPKNGWKALMLEMHRDGLTASCADDCMVITW